MATDKVREVDGGSHPPGPTFYYAVNNQNNPIATSRTQIRRMEHLFWEENLPPEEADLDSAVASLSAATGESRTRINFLVLAFAQLRELPRLNALQHELFHLDLNRIIAISTGLFGLHPCNLGSVDDLLTEYLTAGTPNEILPSAESIRRRIKSIRDALDDARATSRSGTQQDISFGVEISPEGSAEVGATIDAVDGKLLREAVEAHASATGMSPAQAFVDIIRNRIRVTVILNLYKARDLVDAPVWADGLGWVDRQTGSHWEDQAARTRDMDAAGGTTTEAHDPPADLRSAVVGRDGCCRFPGCRVPASRCQADHRVNHSTGGPTCRANLVMLCQHHHNMKTDGRVNYLLDPHTGIIVWLFLDGSWAVTTPEGPLTPVNARWAQTVSQYRARHHQSWRDAATRENQPEDRDAPDF
ncbi:HNH endonuclease signature motif containing protein [Corynebacterium pacaense]|uniref:HNH endonuclease signature motif containing protein n=1 Tax=Corynebacterium pacaense TaxID=1816684 RepID=UPI0009BAA1AE|nr:HNH endonuclease signature motif containing protein [Corynebacterium pacaense]